MSRVLVAGVDTSTQSTKVRVTDAETGEMVRFGQAKHPDGTSVNPDAWWQAFQEAAEQAGGLDDVAALAVGGQQHGMVLLDDHGRVIRDALLWNDTRSATNADVLIACLGEAEKAADGSEDDLSDDPAMRGRQRWVKAVGSSLVASLTITKVAWVAANEPENAARITSYTTSTPFSSRMRSPLPATMGFGSIEPTTTRVMPCERIRSVHAGCDPTWQQGSRVSMTVAPCMSTPCSSA